MLTYKTMFLTDNDVIYYIILATDLKFCYAFCLRPIDKCFSIPSLSAAYVDHGNQNNASGLSNFSTRDLSYDIHEQYTQQRILRHQLRSLKPI